MMRLRRHLEGALRAAAVALAMALAPSVAAQAPAPAALTADRLTYDRETGRLVAEGSVEVLYGTRMLRASRIVYDERAGVVRAEGPLVLVDPAQGVALAEAAELTPDLAEGLVEGARVLIAGQLQLAAVEARRRDGRFVTLDRAIASSCTICAGEARPTWAVRASRVVQDEAAERIYFENARLEVFGLPILYAPRFSIPDPRVERASGFLAPRFLNSQLYGAAVKLPYYRVLGPSADATITPFVTTSGGRLLEGEFRRRFADGALDLGGVYAFDDGLDADLSPRSNRWTLFGEGVFALDKGFVFDFDASLVSDDVFLKQFDYSNADLLTSFARIRRTRAKDDFRLELIAFQSLLPDDDAGSLPAALPDFAYRRVLADPVAGGRVGLEAAVLALTRDDGPGSARGTAAADWRRDWTLGPGLRLGLTGALAADAWRVWRNADSPDTPLLRIAPAATLDLRWPLVRRDRAEHLLEPIAQVIFSDALGDDAPPNEDSELPEFSYSNLFDLNRFPGRDRLETGLRANLGLRYARLDPAGWSLDLTLGRVLRATDLDQFPQGAGLDGRWSDFVGAASIGLASGLALETRFLVSDDLDLARNETALRFDGERLGVSASYIYLAEDDSNPFLGPQPETSEINLAGRYRLRPNWEIRGGWRYDATAGSNLRASGGVTYGNECAEIDLSVSRRYTASDNLPPSTTIGFGLRLAGLGASTSRDWPSRACAAAPQPARRKPEGARGASTTRARG